ncbi:MAG: 30S ribosomal protein S1 [Desulfosalsimonadaceae bacterium]
MPDDFNESEISDDETAGDEKDIAGDESFADLFESYMTEQKEVNVGDRINGEIISIGDKNVFINTGTKTDGVVEKGELLDKDGQLPYKKGDRLDLYIVAISDGEIRLSKAISGAGMDHLLHDAYKTRIPVEGKVVETCKGGFRVSIMNKTAFCPISQMDTQYVETPEGYVGNTYEFLLTKFEDRGKNIIVSRRDLLKKQQEAAKKEFFTKVQSGDIVDAVVKTIMPYGAFVEIYPGVEGLIHISELSWTRLGHPNELVKTGDPIKAKILDINKDTGKISMSARQAATDPWLLVNHQFKNGDKTEGKVTRCTDFGAFVEIAPGIEGLVHISEMSYQKRISKASDVVSPGDVIPVMIKEIDLLNKRMSLSMKAVEGDPWTNIEGKYAVGQQVFGKIEKKESFGYFIQLEPGVTGMLPKSKISAAHNPADIEKLKIDDPIAVKIEEIKPRERKISLGVEGDTDDWKAFVKKEAPPSSFGTLGGALGDLGQKLQSALNSKKK